MIAPSLWCQDIAKLAKAIEKRTGAARISPTASMKLEKELMMAFYLVHKLLEDHRIDDKDGAIPVAVEAFPSGNKMDYLRDPKCVTRTLLGGEKSKLKLGVLANKIIHSYLIVPFQVRDQPTRIVLCSNFDQNKRLFAVEVSELIGLLKQIGGELASV